MSPCLFLPWNWGTFCLLSKRGEGVCVGDLGEEKEEEEEEEEEERGE